MSNLIFLDIDGVLNNRRSMQAAADPAIRLCPFPHQITRTVDPYCVGLLNGLVRDTSAFVVISSTWRMYHPETILPCLEWGGFKHTGMVFGATPINDASRGEQIAEWLEREYAEVGVPFNYVILDDDSDFFPEQRPRHVKTNHEVGLTVEDVLLAKALLTGVP